MRSRIKETIWLCFRCNKNARKFYTIMANIEFWDHQKTISCFCWQHICFLCFMLNALQWRHNGRDGVSNQQPHDCLLNRLFRRRSKKTSKLRVTGLCAGNSPGTGEIPAQMASYAENVSIDDVIMERRGYSCVHICHIRICAILLYLVIMFVCIRRRGWMTHICVGKLGHYWFW